MDSKHLLLPLNRPEYIPVPEALISALAWKLFDVPLDRSGRVPLGIVYDGRDITSGSVHVRRMFPTGDAMSDFEAGLRKAGLVSSAKPGVMGEAVANSVRGIRSTRGQVQASSPMTPALALMQDLRGMQVKPSPADLGGIIESVFSLGQSDVSEVKGVSAAELWLHAAEHRMQEDALVQAIDNAFQVSVLGGERTRSKERVSKTGAIERAGLYKNTPFSWFRETWVRLTSDAWVEALPSRVWVDWATTVLRLGLGMGFLWEASWYDAVARDILNRKARTWQDLLNAVPEPLPWKPLNEGISIRDVAGHAKRRIERGDRLRTIISTWLAEGSLGQNDLFLVLDEMSADRPLTASLIDALSSDESSGKTWEAIRYMLVTRESSGQFTDYYGVLRQIGRRYLVVEPGTEWIAVVASLACVEPGGSCDVGRVLTSLTKLGMRPELSDLINLLERAGMARGSADADNAVIVQSAF